MNVVRAYCVPCGAVVTFGGKLAGIRAAAGCCHHCGGVLRVPAFPESAPARERCALSPAEYIASQRLVEAALAA